MEMVRTPAMTPTVSLRRVARIVAVAACLSGADARAAEPKAVAHHAHAAVSGVRSLDVYAGGERLHLLTGEDVEGQHGTALLYRKSEDGGATWTPPVRVDAGLPPAFSPHRGMDAQLAAAGDRVIAAWTTAGTDQWGSGPVATALSSDGGKTWRAGPNPADDGSTTGHGFLDLATDGAGVFHLTWLDSRDGKQGLRYARSESAGASWSANATAKAGTCECCPNTLIATADGEAAILFRDHAPRDMRLVRSRDHGRRWLPPVPAGGFDWQFNGCPHVGGGLAFTGKGGSAVLHAVAWTGKPERAGVYHVSLPQEGGPAAEPQQLGGATASHPDLAAHEQRLGAVWDQAGGTSGIWGATSADAGRTWSEPRRLSAPDATAAQPRVVWNRQGFRAFWTEERPGQKTAWASATLP